MKRWCKLHRDYCCNIDICFDYDQKEGSKPDSFSCKHEEIEEVK